MMSRQRCRVLVVDDEVAMREVLLARIERWGFPVRAAANVKQARELVTVYDPHLVISDLVLPDATGMDLLRVLRGDNADRRVLLITAYGTIDAAVQAIKLGATDFLTKPLDYMQLRRQIEAIDANLGETADPTARGASIELPDPPPEGTTGGMVGSGAALTALLDQVRLAARSQAPVLIVGESGTGKELVARTIHDLGPRAAGHFVPVNAAATPEALIEGEFFGFERGAFTGATQSKPGLFEQADQGTLFLDEVTEMPMGLQSKFLRVLEDGSVRRLGATTERRCDARIMAATNRDPAAAVEQARLRPDVLYRLDVLRINVPALRDRKDDIPALVAHFIADCRRRYRSTIEGLSGDAMQRLLAHAWPGNIRELRNVVERAFVAGDGGLIEVEHLGMGPSDSAAALPEQTNGIVIPSGVTAAEAEKIVILETLKRTDNNKAEAARRLGLDVKTIRNKLKSFGAWSP